MATTIATLRAMVHWSSFPNHISALHDAADALEAAEKVIGPFTRLGVRSSDADEDILRTTLKISDLRAVQAWRDKYGSRT